MPWTDDEDSTTDRGHWGYTQDQIDYDNDRNYDWGQPEWATDIKESIREYGVPDYGRDSSDDED